MTNSTYMTKRKISLLGREREIAQLNKISNLGEAAIVIVYGRRRVGKTELIEQTFSDRNLLKFEGIQGKDKAYQLASVHIQLQQYVSDPLLKNIKFESWKDFFSTLSSILEKGKYTLYLEELQWLACYDDELISELKYFWDNHFRFNKELLIVLCGSAPSFMVSNVIKSKALFNRSQFPLHLQQLSPLACAKFLGSRFTTRDIFDAYLTLGGMPEYLKLFQRGNSIRNTICEQSFKQNGFLFDEVDRIFISSLSNKKGYKEVVEYLSKKKYATRNELLKKLKISNGGGATALFEDLEQCGFIDKYVPFHLEDNSLLARYTISDNYLQFYYKFIAPEKRSIAKGDFNDNYTQPLDAQLYNKWLGYSFERYCRLNHRSIATLLGFSGVKYRCGAYFKRSDKTETDLSGFQIDLIFARDDRVYTICEIKYTDAPVGISVIQDFEKKLELSDLRKDYGQQRVLISAAGAADSLTKRSYFDKVISLEDLLIV